MSNDAIVSPCGSYRYLLQRGEAPVCAFVLLNPSTADASSDDATTTKLKVFAKNFGFAGYDLYNVGAGRATDPKDWLKMGDPIGPDNAFYLSMAACRPVIVVGWGNNAPRPFVARAVKILSEAGNPLWCFGINKNGSPKHPLYVPYSTELKPWGL